MIITQPKELIGAFVNVRQGYNPAASWGEFNALGLVRGGRLVVGVIYNDYSGMNVYMHVGAEDGKRWITPSFLFSAFDYPFNQLGMRRITAKVKAKNSKAIAFIENLGLEYEGTMRHYFKEDDALIYGMLKANCRFLDIRKAA